MNPKTILRNFLYCLAILALAASTTAAAASPAEQMKSNPKVFVVHPTGGDDTSPIRKAFADAQAAGPGSTVQFSAGTFVTDLIYVVNFNGFMKGKGQGETIITARANLSCQQEIDQGFLPSLFRFTEGNIQVSDLTIQISNPDPCVPYTFSWWGGSLTTWLYGGITFAGPVPVNMTNCAFIKKGKVDAVVDRVSVIARDGVVVVSPIFAGGDFIVQDSCSGYGYDTETNIRMTRSYFENGLMGDILIQNINGGRVMLQDNKMVGGGTGIFVSDVANASVLIADNLLEFPNSNGIVLGQGLYPDYAVPVAPAQFSVRGNTIKIRTDYNWGVALIDNSGYLGPNETPRLNAVVQGNQFLLDGPTTLGVMGMGAQNARVLDNRFSGQGESAIANGYSSSIGDVEYLFPSVGWLIAGNDMRALNPYPPATSLNQIVLGALSRDCKVIANSLDTVLDLGTNNVIITARHQHGGLAPDLHHGQKTLKHTTR